MRSVWLVMAFARASSLITLRVGEVPRSYPETLVGQENAGARDGASLEQLQRLVGDFQGELGGGQPYRSPGRFGQELPAVGAGVRGDRADPALVEQVRLVVQRRHGRHVDSGQGQR